MESVRARGGRWSGLLVVLPALAAFLFCLADPKMFVDGDTNWHLAAGRWILSHGAAPRTDPFSYTAAGRPWTDLEWLSEVLMALSYAAAGWSGVMVLFGAAVGAAVALVILELRRWLDPLSVLAALVLSFPLLAAHILARPHVLAAPILALWTCGLLSARRHGRAPSLWLLPLMILWANLHGSYLFGLAMIAPFAVEAVLESPDGRLRAAAAWGGFMLAAILAALITPFGPGGVAHAVQLTTMPSLDAIKEWKPVNFQHPGPLEFALLLTLFVCLHRGVRLGWVRLVLLLAVLHMALQHVRHEIILAIVAPLLLARPVGEALGSRRLAQADGAASSPWRGMLWPGVLAAVLALGLAGLRIAAPEARVDSEWVPVTALANVPGDIAARPVFNEYGFGGWLILNGVRPFIDGRNDMYGDAAMQGYIATEAARSPGAVAQTFGRYGVAWTILKPSSPLAASLDKTPGWVRFYADPWAVVHVRSDILRASQSAPPAP